jgi:hypothetical protein
MERLSVRTSRWKGPRSDAGPGVGDDPLEVPWLRGDGTGLRGVTLLGTIAISDRIRWTRSHSVTSP